MKQLLLILILMGLFTRSTPFNWIQALNNVGKVVTNIERSPFFLLIKQIDLTGGAKVISWNDVDDIEVFTNVVLVPLMRDSDRTDNLVVLGDTVVERKPGLLKVHQLGRNMIKKLPDGVLLGLLAFISTELVQREVGKQAHAMPSVMRDIANRTLLELDDKLELLTALQWNFQPFLQGEYDNLQTQPVEIIDKYLVSELLVRLDKDLSPYLSKMVADPKKVKDITNKLKDVAQVISLLALPRRNSLDSSTFSQLQKTNSLLVESVESVGVSIELAVLEWNRLIGDVTKIVKTESLAQYIARTKTQQAPVIQEPPPQQKSNLFWMLRSSFPTTKKGEILTTATIDTIKDDS